MALSLFAKKLSKKPIGTHVELTVDSGEDLEKVAGVITDSDFSASVEVTTYEGKDRLLDYVLIKGFQETKSLEEVLKELTEGTRVRFSHGSEENREPNLTGTVGENDGESSIEIIPSNGKEMILSYSIIRSLLVLTQGKEKHGSEDQKKCLTKPRTRRKTRIKNSTISISRSQRTFSTPTTTS